VFVVSGDSLLLAVHGILFAPLAGGFEAAVALDEVSFPPKTGQGFKVETGVV